MQNKKKKSFSKRGREGSEDYVAEPEFVAASAILLACEQRGREVSVKEVADVVGISELKLKRLYPKIRSRMIDSTIVEAE